MPRRNREPLLSPVAKLTPPALASVLYRKRLFRLLDHATTSPLTWITASPGAGKSILLASYLRKQTRKVIWYRLDAGDEDPSTFFGYLKKAVEIAAPRVGTQLLTLITDYMAGLSVFTQRFFEQLGSSLLHPTVIVFDDYHEVLPHSRLHELLPIGVQQLPPHIRVVVLSRERPPASYARLQVEQHGETIPATALSLTRQEARQLSRLRRRANQPYQVDHWWEVSQGWMSGFVLLLQYHARERTALDVVPHQCPQTIFDYFTSEVMKECSQESQAVLLSVSIVSDFTPEMAQQLSGVPHASDILEQIYQSGYFVERRGEGSGWYRFHPLFQEFLLRRAERTWSATEMRERRREAARLLVATHREEEAITLLQQAHAWEDCRDIVRTQAPLLTQQGRLQTLDTWIRQLPEAQREIDPWMDFWLAKCRLLGAPHEAATLYESAMRRFQQEGQRERAGMLLAWAGAVQSILVAWSGLKHVCDLVEVFKEIHPDGTAYPSRKSEAVVAQAMAMAYMQMLPDRPEARTWLDRAVALAHVLPASERVLAMVHTTIFYILLGEGDKAQSIFDSQRSVWEHERAGSMQVMMACIESTLAWWSGQVDRCRDIVQHGLTIAKREGSRTWDWFLYGRAVYNELILGDIPKARNLLAEMKPIASSGSSLLGFLLLAAWADLIERDVDQATKQCRRARNILEAEGFPMWYTGMYCLIKAQVLRARNLHTRANQMLARVEAVGKILPWNFRFGVFSLRAQWAFEDGNSENGMSWLKQLLAEGQGCQQISYLGRIPQEASQLFASALERGIIEDASAQNAIRAWHIKPPADGHIPENWPWRVKILAFGKFRAEVDGKPLHAQRKTPHRLLELLAAIIYLGGRDVRVSQLTAVLPTKEQVVDRDTVVEEFKKYCKLKKYLNRIRTLLGIEKVIYWKEKKISLNLDFCWGDVWAFKRLAEREDERAITLYKEPFGGVGEIPEWADEWREKLRNTFIRLVGYRCDRLQKAHEVDEVIQSLKRAIEADPLTERLHGRLIQTLWDQGRRDDAQRQYQSCVKAYRRWNRALSEETEMFAQKLKL